MTELFVTNSLNYHKTVKFNLTLRYFVIKGERGEHMWTLELATTHAAADGSVIPSKKIHWLNGAVDLDEVIENSLAELCTYIDWTPYLKDLEAPNVISTIPENDTTVSIRSNVYINLKDYIPSAGIDLSEMKVILNNGTQDIEITEEVEITGDPYEYQLFWKPPIRVEDTYD
jgi:hypothetical protein